MMSAQAMARTILMRQRRPRTKRANGLGLPDQTMVSTPS
jgi:hypothetical protein